MKTTLFVNTRSSSERFRFSIALFAVVRQRFGGVFFACARCMECARASYCATIEEETSGRGKFVAVLTAKTGGETKLRCTTA